MNTLTYIEDTKLTWKAFSKDPQDCKGGNHDKWTYEIYLGDDYKIIKWKCYRCKKTGQIKISYLSGPSDIEFSYTTKIIFSKQRLKTKYEEKYRKCPFCKKKSFRIRAEIIHYKCYNPDCRNQIHMDLAEMLK